MALLPLLPFTPQPLPLLSTPTQGANNPFAAVYCMVPQQHLARDASLFVACTLLLASVMQYGFERPLPVWLLRLSLYASPSFSILLLSV